MSNKKILLVLGSVIVLAIIVMIISLMKSEKSLFKATSAENKTMDALIQNYADLTDPETKKSVWLHVLKTCPYWKAMVEDQVARHGGSIEERYIIEANWNINKGYDPGDWMKKCNDKPRSIEANKRTDCLNWASDYHHKDWTFNWGAKKKLKEKIDKYCKG